VLCLCLLLLLLLLLLLCHDNRALLGLLPVVLRALLGVEQNLLCDVDELELLVIPIGLVRMEPERQPPERLSDLGRRRTGLHAQHLVVCALL
jgi:hypothetical protein